MQCDDRLDDGIGRITGDLCRRSMCEFFVGCSGRLSVLARCAAGLCGLHPVPSVSSRHSASIPHACAPTRLRHCALRLPPGDLRQAHPRRAMIGAPVREPNRLAPDRPGRRPAAMGRALRRIRRGLLRQVVRMRVVLDAGGSRLSRHEGWFTAQRPASLWSFHTTPQWRRRRVGQGRSRPSSGCCLGPRQGASQ